MKHPWESINNHIDPEKEEQLKWLKIEFENQVKRVIKLTKGISHGNNERNMKNKSIAINIVEDFQKQYESLYLLYEDLREQVKKNVAGLDEDNNVHYSSTSDSDSELFYSPRGSNIASRSSNTSEDLYTTCTSHVKKIDPRSEYGEDLTAQMRYLEAHVESLKLEISTLSVENRELKDRLECESDEAMKTKEKISRLEAQVSGTEAKLKENERRMYSVEQFEDREKKYMSRISQLVGQANEMERSSSQVEGLMEQISSLKKELVHAHSQKNELKLELDKKSEEKSACAISIESLKNELRSNGKLLTEEREGLKTQLRSLESKLRSLLSTKSELEMQLNKLNHEASQSLGKISELQILLSGKEIELSVERKKFVDFQNIMSSMTDSRAEEVKNLKSELEIIDTEKTRLQTELDKAKEEYSLSKSLVEKISKSNFQGVEKKVEDMFEEYRKQLDDKYRILSRRIRVTELLQAENKECYQKAKDAYEQQNKDLKNTVDRNEIELKNIKDMMLAANDLLTSLDSVASTFEECSANFLNRITKASCQLQFTKQLAVGKNKTVVDVKGDEEEADNKHSPSKDALSC